MKIEIMDLLHKIYNLDDMPKKIIFENCVWGYCSEFQDYQSERGYLFGDYISHINETGKFLNAEVEIINCEDATYKSSYDAEKVTGIGRTCIGGCCRKEHHTAGGYIWKFAEEDKPIIEKIDLFDDLQDILNNSDESIVLNAIHKCLTTEKYKLNEIIEFLNRKEDKNN